MKLSVKIHPAGWVFLALMMACLPASSLLAAVFSLILHESGHVLAMSLCGIRECRIELTPFGGVADATGYERLPAVKKILCALAGPLASLMGVAVGLLPWWAAGEVSVRVRQLSLAMAMLNLLPVFPLDGARALVALAEKVGLGRFFTKVTLAMAYLFALFMFFLGVLLLIHGKVNVSLFLLPPYLCYTAYQSALYTRIRGVGKSFFPKQIPPGEIRSAKVFASCGEPGKIALMRHVQGVNPDHLSILYICDETTGAVSEMLTTKQICHKLISE